MGLWRRPHGESRTVRNGDLVPPDQTPTVQLPDDRGHRQQRSRGEAPGSPCDMASQGRSSDSRPGRGPPRCEGGRPCAGGSRVSVSGLGRPGQDPGPRGTSRVGQGRPAIAGAKAMAGVFLPPGMGTLAMRKAKDSALPEAPPRMGEVSEPVTYKVALATRAPGPFQLFTARHASLVVDAHPVRPSLLLQCPGRKEDLDDAREVLGSASPVVRESRADGRMTLLLEAGEAEDPLIALLTSRAAHVIPPIRWQGGEARVPLLLDDATDLRELTAPPPRGGRLSERA